jgi:hypothetical protein
VKTWAMNWRLVVKVQNCGDANPRGKRERRVITGQPKEENDMKLTEGAELAMKIKDPRYAAPLYERVPVALIRAPTPYDWMADPTKEVPQAAAAEAASFDLTNSSFELAAWARW